MSLPENEIRDMLITEGKTTTEAGDHDMTAQPGTRPDSYAVSHPLVKHGKPIVFDTAAEAAQAKSLIDAHANFAAWLFSGGVLRKDPSK